MASLYELARLENIARNAAELERLGLSAATRPTRKPNQAAARGAAAAKRKRKKAAAAAGPLRRSTRRKPAVTYAYNNDDDDDDGDASEWSDELSDDDGTPPPPTKRLRSVRIATATTTAQTTNNNKPQLLTVENAKTGRSSCRCCREKIPKDAPRVGMLSWIVGRNAMTWQKPSCFLSRLCVAAATNNNTTCKASKLKIPRGAVKLGCRSHTTTAWVSLAAFPELILSVLRAAMESNGDDAKVFVPRDLEGVEDLNEAQRAQLVAALDRADALVSAATPSVLKDRRRTKRNTKKKNAAAPKKTLGDTSDQPQAGAKTNARGPVTWKFGAYLCHGVLLPGRETKTHCYARTHKGNVKTLKKGGTYWRLGD